MLTSKQRAALRAAANGEETLFQIGKGGIDPNVTQSAEDALAARELIKLRVLPGSPLSVREAAEELARQAGADVVQVIGTRFVLFRQKKKESRYDAALKG